MTRVELNSSINNSEFSIIYHRIYHRIYLIIESYLFRMKLLNWFYFSAQISNFFHHTSKFKFYGLASNDSQSKAVIVLNYTNFFVSKNVFKCRICQKPMHTRTMTWARDHHSTRLFVLSLVCRKRSSRYWKKHWIYFWKSFESSKLTS